MAFKPYAIGGCCAFELNSVLAIRIWKCPNSVAARNANWPERSEHVRAQDPFLAERVPSEEHYGGSRRSDARKARPDHGGGEQSINWLGHRQGSSRSRCRTRIHLPGR